MYNYTKIEMTSKNKVIVFDTETTGLPKTNQKPNKWNTHLFPHIVQFSWFIFDTNLKKIIKTCDYIIKLPDGIEIPIEATNVHGISEKMSLEQGIDIKVALREFTKDLHDSHYLVAHNINFDKKVVSVEYLRNNCIDWMSRHRKIEYCTLANSINVCKIEKISKANRKYFKWPKLMETHEKLFKTIPNNLHNSLIDIYVCFRCFHMLAFGQDINKINPRFSREFNQLCGL
jgi:DNA polymerase III epsilon subunit-like protein